MLTEKQKQIFVWGLFVAFIGLRIFSSFPVAFLGSDQVKYIEVANRFPAHTLYNDQLFLEHPPLYPAAIHFVNLIFNQDYVAAIFLNLVSAGITFFILYRLFMFLTKNFYVTYFVLFMFTLSVEFIFQAHTTLKESFGIMLIFCSIYFFVKGIKTHSKKHLFYSTIFGMAVALTFDHVVFLFPTLVLSYLFFNKKKVDIFKFKLPNLTYLILPLLFIGLAFGGWLVVKAYQYSQYEFYPQGLDGAPIITEGFGLIELLNPSHFEGYESGMPSGLSFRPLDYAFRIGYMFNSVPFNISRGLNFSNMHELFVVRHAVFIFLIYLPLAICALIGVLLILKDLFSKFKIHGNSNLYLFLVFGVFLAPVILKTSTPRYILVSFVFLYYFIGCGLYYLLSKIKLDKSTIIPGLLLLVAIVSVPVWYASNDNFVLTNQKLVHAPNTADYINRNLPEDAAFMGQPGYPIMLTHQTGRRMIGLPPDGDKLLFYAEEFDIDYVIFGEFFTNEWFHFASDSTKFVRENPQHFRLVAEIEESYPVVTRPASELHINEYGTMKEDVVYIYKIVRK